MHTKKNKLCMIFSIIFRASFIIASLIGMYKWFFVESYGLGSISEQVTLASLIALLIAAITANKERFESLIMLTIATAIVNSLVGFILVINSPWLWFPTFTVFSISFFSAVISLTDIILENMDG